MGLRNRVMSGAAQLLTSSRRRRLSRQLRALRRRLSGGEVIVEYFHQSDDPYSHLCVQMLDRLRTRYRIVLKPWLVPPPDAAAAPELERLRAWAIRDARRLANAWGLTFGGAQPPDPLLIGLADQALAAAVATSDFAARAVLIGEALWAGDHAELLRFDHNDAALSLAAGAARRAEAGHYLGATFYCEGEWYWGIDRFGDLEERLSALGRDLLPEEPPLLPRREPSLLPPPQGQPAPGIDLWFSFRSPYSWLVMPRIRNLAAHYGCELRLRFILPMVMRGLPVPGPKRMYIMLDCKREAERLGLSFGKTVDPVGAGVERALAVLHRAIESGQGGDFGELGLRAAFADGINLADQGLYEVAQRAGIDATTVDAALADDSWRPVAEANRTALFEAGLWGAPTFRIDGGEAHWGQDRLWMLEDDIRAAMA